MIAGRQRMRIARALGIAALLFASGCRRHVVTAPECEKILDRIVDLELHELGFRDPVLAQRKEVELRRTLAAELHQCEGVRVREGALECVATAATVEEISHRCLR
jgi:hypothetical protein